MAALKAATDMTIQQFIEKSVEGGYRTLYFSTDDRVRGYLEAGILLDPEAWKAVGKVEGWSLDYETEPEHELDVALACWCKPNAMTKTEGVVYVHRDIHWRGYWHALLDALAEGKSIKDYLKTL